MAQIYNIRQASESVLECRSMGHAWEHINDEDIRRRAGEVVAFRRVEACRRCGAERWREVDLMKGEITHRGMRYPAEYLLAPGSPRPSRLDALRVLYTR